VEDTYKRKRPTKETCQRDQLNRPTKEPYKRDLNNSPYSIKVHTYVSPVDIREINSTK